MSTDGSVTSSAKSVRFAQDGGIAEERIRRLEDKMNLLDSFSKTDDILRWIKGQDASHSKVSDMWNLINLQKRVEGTENGVKRVCHVLIHFKLLLNIYFCFQPSPHLLPMHSIHSLPKRCPPPHIYKIVMFLMSATLQLLANRTSGSSPLGNQT